MKKVTVQFIIQYRLCSLGVPILIVWTECWLYNSKAEIIHYQHVLFRLHLRKLQSNLILWRKKVESICFALNSLVKFFKLTPPPPQASRLSMLTNNRGGISPWASHCGESWSIVAGTWHKHYIVFVTQLLELLQDCPTNSYTLSNWRAKWARHYQG